MIFLTQSISVYPLDVLAPYFFDKQLHSTWSQNFLKTLRWSSNSVQVKQKSLSHIKASGGTKRSLLIGLVISTLEAM